MLNSTQFQNITQDSKRRLCKFTTSWCLFKEFQSWLVPVKYQNQKAYCILCRRVFSVSHSGLHDVKAHWKGKKHLQLQEQEMEKNTDESVDSNDIKAYYYTFNEELNTLEEMGQDGREYYNNHDGYHSSENHNFRSISYPDSDDIVVENILTPTVTLDSDPENSASFPSHHNNIDKDMSLQIKSQITAQQYCLRWKYHHNNLQVMFIQLLQRESFCDVTLACEGKMLRAHKVVLSACSTYFDKIFSEHEEKDPVVILKDVKFVDIKALVEFMYKGEINVENSHLNSLLKTAEDLKIKGLADVSGKSIPKEEERERKQIAVVSKDNVDLYNEDMGDEDSENIDKLIRDEPMIDYEDFFTPALVDASLSNEESDNDEDGYIQQQQQQPDKPEKQTENQIVVQSAQTSSTTTSTTPTKISEVKLEKPDVFEPQNEQSFSTLIAHLSDTPAGVQEGGTAGVTAGSNGNSVNDEDRTSAETEHATEMATLQAMFPEVVKMNDYLTTGRRQQFWEEPFTRRMMEAIKNKEIEMKAAAELMGVSYGTLYGRYRDAYGCLKHPYRTKDFWSEQGPADILAKLNKKEITLFRAAEMLNVTVTTLANYLTTLRYEQGDEGKESGNEDEEEMDINETMSNFLSGQAGANNQDDEDEDDDDDSQSSSNAIDRSEDDYP